ncbi:hypothetical protein [Kineosporia babensis]|uniref:LSDAT prokaryote domain-containing protein n=1 Tax=Kineosporia babensis TaxID=499548 RepID=A0A9X1SVZ2_9ACTN|nr:hypothetical protein [Kineosporia babensis]MCD5314487.1 hypothetical protein [Kineosporia babensis]
MPEVAQVNDCDEAARVLSGWGVAESRPVLVCVGGAQGLEDERQNAVRRLLSEHVLPVLERRGAVVVDGGTNAGLMRLLGEAAVVSRTAVPLIGVAAAGTVLLPGRPALIEDAAEPDPNHTGLLLFPGAQWGDEVPWIDDVAALIAGACPSATLMINGGEIAYRDVQTSVSAGRPVVAVAGTGRAADAIAQASRSEREDGPVADLAASGLVRTVGIDDPEAVGVLVDRLLSA